MKKTYLVNPPSNKHKGIRKAASTYNIEPGEELHDIFFVDLKKAPRNIFAKIVPTLIVGRVYLGE